MGKRNTSVRRRAVLAAAVTVMAPKVSGAADGDWEFALSPMFLWGVSIDGSSTIEGNEAPLDLDFTDDILENMDAVFTAHFEARRNRWGFFAEFQYIDLEPGFNAKVGPVDVGTAIDFEEAMWEIGAGYVLNPYNEKARLELIAGARYTDQDIEVDVDLSAINPGQELLAKVEGGDQWWHGFAGVRLRYELSEKWTLVSRIDGGYGGSDNSAFNFAFQFDWRFSDWGSAFLGGRYLSYDYESNDYGFDASKSGPLAGLTIHW